MEVCADGHIVKRERGILCLRSERQFAVLVAAPKYSSFRELHILFAFKCFSLGSIWSVKCERNLLSAQYAHLHQWLFLIFHASAWCRLVFLYALHHLLHLGVTECHFAQYRLGLVGGETLEVLLSWSDYQSCHVQSSGTDEILRLTLCLVAIRTMLLTWEHHRQVLLRHTPTHHIHHRLCLAFVLRQ